MPRLPCCPLRGAGAREVRFANDLAHSAPRPAQLRAAGPLPKLPVPGRLLEPPPDAQSPRSSTTLTGTNRAVVRFYNQRGTAEQWIKEGKEAIHWTRLCHRFRANEAR